MTALIDRLSTHVLDTTLGRPAVGIRAVLEHLPPTGAPVDIGHGRTDADGRITQLNLSVMAPGEYRLSLATADYFADHHPTVFYPAIVVQFVLPGDRQHYHIAILTSTYSYTTYLGS
jgi:5-hydroxyisourate hydrolase